MKKICFLLFVIVTLSHQAQNLIPAKDNIACLWGMKDQSGKWIVAPKYTLLEKNYGNFFLAMLNDKWGMLSPQGKEIIPLEYDRLTPIQSETHGGRREVPEVKEIIAVKAGKSGLIDMEGKILIPFQYDALWKNYGENYFYIQRDKKTGIRNYEKELLLCRYAYLQKINRSTLFVVGSIDPNSSAEASKADGKNMGVINIQGDTIIPCRFDEVHVPDDHSHSGFSRFSLGNEAGKQPLTMVSLHGKLGLYSLEGKYMLEPRYELARVPRLVLNGDNFERHYMDGSDIYFENSPLVFRENGKYGIVTPGKGIVQPPVFDSVFMQMPTAKRPGFYRVVQNGKTGLLNADGSTHQPCRFKRIMFYSDHIFISKKPDPFS